MPRLRATPPTPAPRLPAANRRIILRSMDNRSHPIREAQRVFVFMLVARLVLGGLGVLAWRILRPPTPELAWAPLGLALLPTLLALALAVIPWFERALGHWRLPAAIALDIANLSLSITPVLFLRSVATTHPFDVLTAQPWLETLWAEPLLMLLIPLVLLAWAYGRRGALWGSTWAMALHLGTGYWAVRLDLITPGFWVRELTRLLLLYMAPLVVSVLARRQRDQLSALEAAHARLQRHTATMEQLAVSRERARLARDLHDTLAHTLAALAVQLEALRTVQAHDPARAAQATEGALATAREGLEESRRAIQALRADPLAALGLAGALRGLLQGLETRTGAQTELSVAGDEGELSADEAAALYRIAEEALANIERHAAARRVGMRLALGDDRTDLEIWDDGVGFDPAAVGDDRYGLTGMNERAALIGARIAVSSAPGRGARVLCTLER